MPRQSPFSLRLTAAERATLERIARKYTSPYRDVVRAKIILYATQRLTNQEIAHRLDLPRQMVSKWRKRFFEQRLDGLEELPRHGRPPRFSPQDRD
jgi:transposase